MDRHELRLSKLIAAQALVDKLLAEAEAARKHGIKHESPELSQLWLGMAVGMEHAAELLDDLL